MHIDPLMAADLTRHAVWMTVVICAPSILVGLVVGVVISLFQAVTQIQDQTLALIPKIVAMLAVAVLTLPWVGVQLIEYARELFAGA